MDDEKLILLVQANECLYNKRCVGYKLAEKKKNVWRQISAEINVPEEVVTKRWVSLRDRYAREKRQENLPSGSGAQMKSLWALMQAMEFIGPYIVLRATRCSYNICDEIVLPCNSPQSSSSSPQLVPLPELSPEIGFKPINTQSMPKRKRQIFDDENSFSEAIGAFKKLCENRAKNEKEEESDPLKGFGKMIVATIGSMNPVKHCGNARGDSSGYGIEIAA